MVRPTEKTSFDTVEIEDLATNAFSAGNFGTSAKMYRVEVSAGGARALRVQAGAGASVCLRASVFASTCLARTDNSDGEVVYAVSASDNEQTFYAEVGAGAQFVRADFYAGLAQAG